MPKMEQVIDPQEIKKILIRSTNWIGDAVMTTPAMGAVRETFPHSEVIVAANPTVAELLSNHPYCDGTIVFDKHNSHGGIKGLLGFCKTLQKERFDLAILFQNAIEAAIIAKLAKIPRRLGYKSDGRGFLLNYGVPLGEQQKRLHHTEYYLHMLGTFGIKGGDGRLVLRCTDEEQTWARQILHGNNWAIINAGASFGSAKQWLPERFAAVADWVASEFNLNVLLTGTRNEEGVGKRVENLMRVRPFNLVGRTSVRQLMAVVSQARLMITNDSGPMHVAAAFGVPLVAIFGSTDHKTTSPLTHQSRLVRHEVECAPCWKRHCPTDHRCMTTITIEEVIEAIRSLWKSCS